jgi:cytochrome c biogenesis protein CcmG, thiol:disulfide interchange protein DsbE
VRAWFSPRRLALTAAVALAAGAVAAGLLLAAPGADLGASGSLPAAERRPAPEVDGRWLVPPPVRLDDLRGKPVVINFWASWCVPCRQEGPGLQRFWQAERARGAVVLGLNMQDVTDDARDFVRQFGMTYPNVRDGGNEVARRYGTTGLPETFFISARGRIVGHVIGVVSAGQLRDGLAAASTGRPLGVEQGGQRRKTREQPSRNS